MPKIAKPIWKVVAALLHMGGTLRSAGLAISGMGMMSAFGYALWAGRHRKIAQHRGWIMRAVAIIYGAATTVIAGIPLYLILGEFPAWDTEIDRWAG